MNPLMSLARWISHLGWYDEARQVKREARTDVAVARAAETIGKAEEAVNEAQDRVTATWESYVESGRRLSH